MNETTILYCTFCYLFAGANMYKGGDITIGDIITFLIAPLAMPIILGKKLK